MGTSSTDPSGALPPGTGWPRRVLVASDCTEASAVAATLAAERFPEAELILMQALDPGYGARVAEVTGLDAETVQDKAYNRADVQLEETAERLRSEGHTVRSLLVVADPVQATLEHGRSEQADLLVIGGACPNDGLPTHLRELMRRADRPLLFFPSAG